MTIEIHGHVEAVEEAFGDKVQLRIRLEMSRSGLRPIVVVYASKAELGGQYWPATPVIVQIRPNTALAQQTADKATSQGEQTK